MGKINSKYLIILIISLLVGLGVYWLVMPRSNLSLNNNIPPENSNHFLPAVNQPPTDKPKIITEPISQALERVTKKPFGIKISPTDSPVSPERFSGYHTGVDFETFVSEQGFDVPIYAICSGPLVLKKSASGYGGVAVQQCQINNEDVTVIYGHLKLSSISTGLNQNLEAGGRLGILGKGFSAETDGERKHLHLGIHKGKDINLLGYVQKPEELSQWLDGRVLLNQ